MEVGKGPNWGCSAKEKKSPTYKPNIRNYGNSIGKGDS
jgi:hypothetical protein